MPTGRRSVGRDGGNNTAMNEPLPPVAAVHVVKPSPPAAGESERAEPLRIEYSSTRVAPELRARLLRTPGVAHADRSVLAESFKMLRNQVLQRLRAEDLRVLAVTSARRIEGKSLTALNLALSIAADFDTAALLVDADLGGHGLQRLLGLADAPGLGDHLVGGTPLAELLVNPGIQRFTFLPAGQQSLLNSAELLATRAAQHLVREMRERYPDRYLVVDLPPLLDTADALAFLPFVETTLVVVEEHTTSIEDIEAVAELMAPFNLVGTVMSQRREDALPATREPWFRRWLPRGR